MHLRCERVRVEAKDEAVVGVVGARLSTRLCVVAIHQQRHRPLNRGDLDAADELDHRPVLLDELADARAHVLAATQRPGFGKPKRRFEVGHKSLVGHAHEVQHGHTRGQQLSGRNLLGQGLVIRVCHVFLRAQQRRLEGAKEESKTNTETRNKIQKQNKDNVHEYKRTLS